MLGTCGFAGLRKIGLAGDGRAFHYFGDDNVDWGAVMAVSVVTTLPVFLLFLPIQGAISPGRTVGAVK